jgi:hypothetical protein
VTPVLELLAGPYPLLHEETPKLFSLWVGYHDSVGVVGNIDFDGFARGCIVSIDGTVYPRNTESIEGRIGFNFKTKGLCVNAVEGVEHLFFEVMDLHMLRGIGRTVDGEFALSQGYSVFPDRYLRGENGKLLRFDESVPTTHEVEEYDFAVGVPLPEFEDGACHFSPGPREDQCFVVWRTGHIYLYDHVQKEAVGSFVRRIPPCLGAWYSPHLGVFVAVHEEEDETHAVRIWADEIKPESVTAPAALTAVFPGAVCRVRARVLGGYSEPCPGHNIAWTASTGTVLDPVTETDADGYAEARILIALTEAASSIDVTATLKF